MPRLSTSRKPGFPGFIPTREVRYPLRSPFRPSALFAPFLFLLLLAPSRWAHSAPAPSGYEPDGSPESLYRLDRLALLRSGVTCRMFSSYDRAGGNDDGFAGTYSKLREENGDSVIAEMQGRGCIQRIWFTHSIMNQDGLLDRKSEHIRVYLDGNPRPVVDTPLERLFSGELEAFPKPLVGSALGGFYSYVPIPYNTGCKVVIEGGGVRFYQITYNEYSHTRPFDSFSTGTAALPRDALRLAAEAWSRPGDPAILNLGADASTSTLRFRLAGGGEAQTASLPHGPRLVRALYLHAQDTTRTLQARLRIHWDDAPTPAVDTPLGLLFGQPLQPVRFRSLLLGNTGDALYCFFPMPYSRGARIAVQSEQPVEFTLTVVTEPADFSIHPYAYFHATYGEQLPTELGLHYPWLNISGAGHFAGVVLATQGRQSEPIWLEGDDKFTADGQLVIHGTGSEDYFNCGWYAVKNRLDRPGALPLHGFPLYRKDDGLVHATAYRWHLTDSVTFAQSLNAKIEHGPTNDVIADYRSLAFHYDKKPEQRVNQPELPVGDECIAYLRESIWQLADGSAERALHRLRKLIEQAPRPVDVILIESLMYYIQGVRDSDPCMVDVLGRFAGELDRLIEEAERAGGNGQAAGTDAPSAPALGSPPPAFAAHAPVTPARLREVRKIIQRAEADLRQRVALRDGIDPGEHFILQARDLHGLTLQPPTYEESPDFRDSFAKVDDLRLLGKGSRFTWGKVERSWARFTPDFPRDGYYQVRVIFSYGANASDTRYVVRHADGITSVALEQRGRPGTARRNNDKWISLGIYRFDKGQSADTGSVTLAAGPGRATPNREIEYRAYSDSMMFEYRWPDLLDREGDGIEDFESGDLRNWSVVSGDLKPQPVLPARKGIEFGQQGQFFVGTTETGGDLAGAYDDTLTGLLRSKAFRPRRDFITFLIGGGKDEHNLYLALVDAETGAILRKATGTESEAMFRKSWEVGDQKGRLCYLEIVDNSTGGWGHLNVDDIRETDDVDQAAENPTVLAGSFFRIYNPGVGEDERWYINDHCFVPAADDGRWHLFGITREEPARPLDEDNFAHATSHELARYPWEKQPFALSVAEEPWGETHLWAPHVVRHDGIYYMFYCAGGSSPTQYRIHLATSTDLWTWKRHPENPVVVDGYAARDPMVLRVDDQWVMYYTANSEPQGGNHIVACVTSGDLIHWSNRRTVFTDPSTGKGGGPTESPFVLRRGRYYYLFLGPRGGYSGTDIFQSTDPFRFRIEDRVGHVAAHAAEVIRDRDGRWYISHCGWDQGGVYLAPLFWNDGQDNPDTSLLPLTGGPGNSSSSRGDSWRIKQ